MGTVPTSGPTANVIPPFTSSGVLPPYTGGDPSVVANMSPYRVTLVDLVRRFATSSERKAILTGYLAHRAHLIQLGVTGIQWLDGSFLEDVETIALRAPGDIDVVSFIYRPAACVTNNAVWTALLMANLLAFDSRQAKAMYRTDAYFVDISFGPEQVIRQTSYWCGLFSHNRTLGLWKGMLEIELGSTSDDGAASQLLLTI